MLRIGGFVPFTTIDYPGALAAVVFCQGCPWRCGYCHNPHLLPARGEHEIAWDGILEKLRQRRGLLDAVVFSGGEPTAQAGLGAAMQAVKKLGFKVGLHTAGAYPRRLAEVLPLVDWVGFDVKAPFAHYVRITGSPGSGARARRSLALLLASRVAHQVRTTVDRSVLTHEENAELGRDLTRCGVTGHTLQACRMRRP